MPRASNGGVELHYETDGDGETVAFVEEVGLGAWSWGWQFPAVAGPFEAVAWDHRGTGRSAAPAGPYALDALAADLEAVLRAVDARRAHLVGLGLGGAVALRYALDYDRARTLTLIGAAAAGSKVDRAALTAADPGECSALLSAAFREAHPDVIEGIAAWRREGDAGSEGARAQAAALDGVDLSGRLHEVTLPALVVHGRADTVVPATAGRALADGLPRGEWRPFGDAGHLVTVERSRAVNDALLGFLEEHADAADA